MGNALKDFGAKFYGGTRRHSYEVNCTIPTGGQILEFHAFSFAMPASIINEIAVPYRGRNLYIPGDRDYQPFTMTVIDDTGGSNGSNSIYNSLAEWQRRLNDHESNLSETGPQALRTPWTLRHLDYYSGQVIKDVTLVGCWPISVGPVILSAQSKNEFLTFDVTVRFDYFILGTASGTVNNSSGVNIGETAQR